MLCKRQQQLAASVVPKKRDLPRRQQQLPTQLLQGTNWQDDVDNRLPQIPFTAQRKHNVSQTDATFLQSTTALFLFLDDTFYTELTQQTNLYATLF